MAWVRIDDQFPSHPKVAKAGPLAGWLFVSGLCYCNRYLTDGFIPIGVVRTLANYDGIMERFHDEETESIQLALRLVDCGLWEEADGGFTVHDYDQYQPTREQIETVRETTRVRVEAFRNKKNGQFGNGNVTPLQDPYNGVSTGVVTPAPNPNPSIERDKSLSSKKNRASSLPSEWVPMGSMLDWALTEYGFDPNRCAVETDKFRDYHDAKGNVMKDWNAAWRNWMRNAYQFSGGKGGKNRPPNPRPDDYVWDDQYSEWRMPDKVGWGG
jgi:hypothetical protein